MSLIDKGFKKPFFIAAGLAAIGVLEFQRIHVPEIVEKKFAYRCKYVLLNLISKASKLGARFKIYPEPILYRKLVDLLRRLAISNRSDITNVEVSETLINNVRVRIYNPKNSSTDPRPVMFYYHGGGFVFNSIDLYHSTLLPLASELQIVIIAIDYPLAPENKYPTPVNESFKVTKQILDDSKKYNLDLNRVVFAGDSAGANMSIALSNQLQLIPKIQVLINPPTQYFNLMLPSMLKYSSIEAFMPRAKMILWHLGVYNVKEYQEDFLIKNFHTVLIDDSLRQKFKSYLNIQLIPEEYRKGKSYYDSYDKIEDLVYPSKKKDNIDDEFKYLVKQLMNENISPGLAEDEILQKQPKTFMIVSELDTRKDEGLIYAQRLMNNGVDVDIAYYENGFHTSFMTDKVGVSMKRDLIDYLKKNL